MQNAQDFPRHSSDSQAHRRITSGEFYNGGGDDSDLVQGRSVGRPSGLEGQARQEAPSGMNLGGLSRLPVEMLEFAQWAVSGASKAPLSVDANGHLYATSVTRPSEWLTFEQACALAAQYANLTTTFVKDGRTITQTGLSVGFILNESDPFTCIDLDVKDITNEPDRPHLWTTAEQFDLYWRIVQTFDSYTERSQSGKGLHIWLFGNIGAGFRRRDGIEVYSRKRYIICTGNTLYDKPIMHQQAMLENMVSQMRPQSPSMLELEEIPEEDDDWLVLKTASIAGNSDKFMRLWAGDWEGFPSQSEADLALLSMFTFYSKSNEQCRRLFRQSGLGKREKATRDDVYINRTLKIIRERQQREQAADISAMKASLEFARSRTITSLQAPPTEPVEYKPDPLTVAASMAPVHMPGIEPAKGELPWPPGFAGQIARYIFQSSVRPVREVAIVATLGLLAGIAGKAWHIPQSGLNLYVILIARSAIGKEAMHSGISSIVKACSETNPHFGRFVDFTEYASGPALIKSCVTNPSFVNVQGEWGRRLKRLADDHGNGDGPLQTLRTQMTNLYQKSGPASIVGGIGYSSKDNNVASVAGVNYSMIGETTPGTFYQALTETMMEDGFMSRFLNIEYTGERPPENENRIEYPDEAMVAAINAMANLARQYLGSGKSMQVARTAEASALMKQFDTECDGNIVKTTEESYRQMWNRAALKSVRIACLFAVADNWHAPCVSLEHVQWAQDVVRRDIALMLKRMNEGDVGKDDLARERKLTTTIDSYLRKPISNSYRISDTMRTNGIVPRNYLLQRIQRSPSFTGHRLGVNKALDDTVASMISAGYLIDVAKDKLVADYNYHGKAYRIVNLPEVSTS